MSHTSPYPQLPITVNMPGGFRWHLADIRWKEWAERANQRIVGERDDQPDVELLKKATRRLIFRLKASGTDSSEQSVVIKSYRMSGLKRRLFRYRRYGPSEAQNLLEAAKRGLPVPEVFGYGQLQQWLLVLDTMIMMEDLAPRRSAAELLREAKGQRQRQAEILDRILELFVRLYRTGCNNIDVREDSIWLSEDPSETGKIIDFHYVRFFG